MIFGEAGVHQLSDLRSRHRAPAPLLPVQNGQNHRVGETREAQRDGITAHSVEFVLLGNAQNVLVSETGARKIDYSVRAHERMLVPMGNANQIHAQIIRRACLLETDELRHFRIARIQAAQIFHPPIPHTGLVKRAVVCESMPLTPRREKEKKRR